MRRGIIVGWLALSLCTSAAVFAVPPPPPEPTTTAAASPPPADPLPEPLAPPPPVVDEREKKLVDMYESIEASERSPGTQREEMPGFGSAFLQMLLVLGGVCGLAYLVLAKMLPRLMHIEAPIAGRKLVQVVDRMPIDQRRSIMVLKIADQYFLVGSSDGGIGLISRLDADNIEGALQKQKIEAPAGPRLSRLAELLKRSPGKEG